ncbi:MAG: hypothetical protein IKK11_02190 [Oscillospiraceae bacterium]|nr:hypothetical protein [Oscillospiraceae bacterium]
MANRSNLTGCSFSILGDSYSTFQGWIPEGNACYYPNPENVDDVLRVEDTWWHQLMQRNQMKLMVNDSYSGATVCTDTRPGQPVSSAFTERVKSAFSTGEQADYIFVFGGTNDSWLERSVGQVKYTHRTQEDLRQTLPAYCEVLEYLLQHNSGSKIVAVVNTELHPDIHKGICNAAEHYGVMTVVLQNIDKQSGHPSALGMGQIANQIQAALEK